MKKLIQSGLIAVLCLFSTAVVSAQEFVSYDEALQIAQSEFIVQVNELRTLDAESLTTDEDRVNKEYYVTAFANVEYYLENETNEVGEAILNSLLLTFEDEELDESSVIGDTLNIQIVREVRDHLYEKLTRG